MIGRRSDDNGKVPVAGIVGVPDVMRVCDAELAAAADAILRAGQPIEGFRLRRKLDELQTSLSENPTLLYALRSRSPRPHSPRNFRESLELGSISAFPDANVAIVKFASHIFHRDRHIAMHASSPMIGDIPIAERLLHKRRAINSAAPGSWSAANRVMGLMGFMLLPASHFPERRLATALRDGLVFGEVRNDYGGQDGAACCKSTAREITPSGEIEHPVLDCPFSLDAEGTTWVFKVDALLPTEAMDAGQRALFERLKEFEDQHGRLLEIAGIGCLFPHHAEFAINCRTGSGLYDQMNRAREEMIDLMMSPGMAQAMGNSRAPATRPPLTPLITDTAMESVNQLIRAVGAKPSGIR
ncbi:conserved hypothetical protein [Hyphomicrobiales bacterium]|nr:conserved hypothetical protein [Hyphomicrobiales bacterium]CAH1702799.1 conserved hypothetical protein [Hyphomicrobiales bacterium]CAI0346988.1 conserved hypothetical protein [Hyphomicrobiales bacterium]